MPQKGLINNLHYGFVESFSGVFNCEINIECNVGKTNAILILNREWISSSGVARPVQRKHGIKCEVLYL